jgi:hypothetical protein
VQEGPIQSDQEQARLAAENPGLDFFLILPKKVNGGDAIVEILDDKEDGVLD